MRLIRAVRSPLVPVALVALAGLTMLGATPPPASSLEGEDWPVYAVAVKVQPPLGDEARLPAIAAAQKAVLERLNPAQYRLLYAYEGVPGLALRLADSATVEEIRAMPEVRAVDRDVGGGGSLGVSGPFIGAPVVHARGLTGQGVAVAILDTGIDTDHPDLDDDLIAGACFCDTGSNCCPTGGNRGTGIASTEDDNGHGTHVAGIISSRGVVADLGIAPDADLVMIKMMNNNRFDSTADIVASLDWLRANPNGAVSVNMSLGTFARFADDCDRQTPSYTPEAYITNLADAVAALRNIGIVSVAAAGNDSDKSRLSVPACLSNVLSVGATGRGDNSIADFTNSNSVMDMWAPGVDILSSYLAGGSTQLSGTSMASPHVAAGIAVLAQAVAPAPADELIRCVTTSGTQITDPVNGVTRPRLDLEDALNGCRLRNGQPCTEERRCQSGFCIDGVCCNDSCGGGADDCLVCSVAAGGRSNGWCEPMVAGTICRASVGACDVAEACDGRSAQCPADAFVRTSTVCRPAGGPCDVAEFCDGTGPECPFDVKLAGECRPSAGLCDVPERCDGLNDMCPPDRVRSSTVACRPANGVCDAAEFCDAVNVSCPRETFVRNGTACNDAVICNGREVCQEGQCISLPLSCDDDDVCTADQCVEPFGCRSTPIEGCCKTDDECDDENVCTINTCVDNACVAAPSPACADSGGGCTDHSRPTGGAQPAAPIGPGVGLLLLAAFWALRRRT